MYRDEKSLMISETSPWPGSIGDSCANTARSEVLIPKDCEKLNYFFTATGCVRHPTAPDGWREDDFSVDQLFPLFMACEAPQQSKLLKQFSTRAGNGQLLSPVAWAIMHEWFKLANIFLWTQLNILFKFPFRYSDADGLKWYQRVERTNLASADWLNWFCACVYLKRKGQLHIDVPVERVSNKVFDYFVNEPRNIAVLQDYEEAFKLWVR